MPFWIAPQLDHTPQVFNLGFFLEMRLCERRFRLFTRSCFHVEFFFFLEFQSYSRHKNHFDISLKQTCSEEIQVIPMDKFSKLMKTFCFTENMK
jgi:hypothetical protein